MTRLAALIKVEFFKNFEELKISFSRVLSLEPVSLENKSWKVSEIRVWYQQSVSVA